MSLILVVESGAPLFVTPPGAFWSLVRTEGHPILSPFSGYARRVFAADLAFPVSFGLICLSPEEVLIVLRLRVMVSRDVAVER